MLNSRIEKNVTVALLMPGVRTLNIVAALQVKQDLIQLIEQHDRVVLDLSGISFIVSSGFVALVAGFNFAKEKFYSFAICNVACKALELVKVTKPNGTFSIYKEIDNCFLSIH